MTTDRRADVQKYRQELRELTERRDELDQEILHVKSALKSLVEMKGVSEVLKKNVLAEIKEADWKKPSLKSSILFILRTYGDSFTANQVKDRLKAAGLFDQADYAQAQAAVGTTLNRLFQSNRVLRSEKNGKVVYRVSQRRITIEK